MTSNDMTLTNANVNDGNAVTIPGGTVSYVWKNITKAEPIDGKYDITESHYGGFENPSLTITGLIDADNKGELGNYMTQKLLIDFASEKSATTIFKAQFGETNVSGTTTSTTSNKLVDSGASFTSNLKGMTVFNETDNTAAIITAVDSDTQLTVRESIFTSGEDYVISSVLGGQPTGGYVTTGDNAIDISNGIDIQIDSFVLNITSKSQFGRRMNFSISIHETS